MTDGDSGVSGAASRNINLAAVNDAPTASNLNAAETYTEDTPLNLTDIVVSDVDSDVTVTAHAVGFSCRQSQYRHVGIGDLNL